AIERILQRFFSQRHEAKSTVLEVNDGMTQRFLQIAEDNQTHPQFIASVDDCAVGISPRKFEQDHLCRATFAHDPIEIFPPAKDWKSTTSELQSLAYLVC